MRFPAKSNVLQFLKEVGIEIGTVLDVGAQTDTPELRVHFPKARHLLFEPASEFHASLRHNYAGMDHEIVRAALSDHDGEGHLRKVSIDGGAVTHAALVGDGDEAGTETVPTLRLDTFMRTREDPKPYLLKIDIDGLELAVVGGADGIWPDIACVIIEATMATLVERMNAVAQKGFRPFDIVDHCYYHGVLSQVDLVFVAERLFDNPNLRPWQTKPFRWKHWIPIAHFEGVVQQAAAAKPIYDFDP